ncbi:MAG: hypothetical protein K6E28_05945 [Eubacterium sp.]|nr:hypothetical protein [Eubacterium sp.]
MKLQSTSRQTTYLSATDAHNVSSRPCMMQRCYDTLTSEWGEETARRLCISTPQQLLGIL